jgi:N-acetylglutamate synthase-like GNAT family acetyltransferase
MERHGDYILDTDKDKLDVDVIHPFLAQTYWSPNIPRAVVETAIAHSLCFGIYREGAQVGFARVITDKATFGYLADVFILPQHRGQGLSKWMMECILAHPDLQGLRRFMLATRDAHGLYAQFGFTPLDKPQNLMQRHRPNPYAE